MSIDQILADIQKTCDNYIDSNLEVVSEELTRQVKEIDQPLKEFKVNGIDKKCWGVYAFFITGKVPLSDFNKFNSLWLADRTEEGKQLHSPAAISSRFREFKNDGWNCLYVGKSENLCGRISQHIHQSTAYTTYGLKLSQRGSLLNDFSLGYSYFIIKSNPAGNPDGLRCITVTLERRLREKLLPIIGKQ